MNVGISSNYFLNFKILQENGQLLDHVQRLQKIYRWWMSFGFDLKKWINDDSCIQWDIGFKRDFEITFEYFFFEFWQFGASEGQAAI